MRFLIESNEDLVFKSSKEPYYEIWYNGKEVGEFSKSNDYLDSLEIYEPYQKQGIGTLVLNKLIKDFGIKYLDVDLQNYGAIRLYERLGFKKAALIFGNYNGDGNDRYIMEYNKLDNTFTIYYQDNFSSDYKTYTILGKKEGNKLYINNLPELEYELEQLNLTPDNIRRILTTNTLKEDVLKEDSSDITVDNNGQILNLIQQKFETVLNPKFGGFYILPTGEALKINKDHVDVDKYLIKQGLINKQELDFSDGSSFMDNLNCIRIRARGGKDSWISPYIILPKNRPTINQYETLESWLDFVLNYYEHILIHTDAHSNFKKYTKQYTADDIIKLIKRYYASGILYESKTRSDLDDLTGKQFGELTVLEHDKEKSKNKKDTYWKCKCSCGKITSVARKHLIDGSIKSCGHTKRQSGLDHIDNFNGMRDRQNKYNTNLEVIRNQKMQPNNTSGVKGVHYNSARKRWAADVSVGGKIIRKDFKNKEDAIKYRQELVDTYYKPKIDSAIKAGDLKESASKVNTGYRTETAYGSGIRDLREILDFEIIELGNVDIPATIIKNFPMKNNFEKMLLDHFVEESERYSRKQKYDIIKLCQSIILRKYPKAKYTLWLADKDIVKSYYGGTDKDIDAYEIEYDTPISDLGREGKLYLYSEIPKRVNKDE